MPCHICRSHVPDHGNMHTAGEVKPTRPIIRIKQRPNIYGPQQRHTYVVPGRLIGAANIPWNSRLNLRFRSSFWSAGMAKSTCVATTYGRRKMLHASESEPEVGRVTRCRPQASSSLCGNVCFQISSATADLCGGAAQSYEGLLCCYWKRQQTHDEVQHSFKKPCETFAKILTRSSVLNSKLSALPSVLMSIMRPEVLQSSSWVLMIFSSCACRGSRESGSGANAELTHSRRDLYTSSVQRTQTTTSTRDIVTKTADRSNTTYL